MALVLAACGTATRFWSSWSANGAQPVSVNGMQIAAVFFNSNEGVRREGEDVIVNEIARYGGVAIPSYTILPKDPQDREIAKAELAKAGVDAVITMRVVSRERIPEYGYAGVPYYGSLWGYWGNSWGSAFDPMYLETDLVVGVETMLYSLEDEKLLWAGMSETFDPDDVESAVKSIARKAVKKMDEESVLTRF
jgi:hypothetical protein